MEELEKDFCFCTLALGSKYHALAKQLAGDLEKYSPGTKLVIYTENPAEFKEQKNILAFQHQQQGILHCYHDKRFVVEKALSLFRVVINIDADTRIKEKIPEELKFEPGIFGRNENLLDHIKKNRPANLQIIKNIANKLNIDGDKAKWIGESLYIVVRDNGREKEFIKIWGIIGSYLELKGMHSGEGNAMGLAAAKMGWNITKSESWEKLNKIRQHLDASYGEKEKNIWEIFKRKLGYHYRLNKARLAALKDFDFYYR
ncbi:hypothetical protein [Aerosakkonema funiforme]|uniref:hypothetical protein n=1 Tax=Aerosakkonema funiforme TaxID=1246630 RepID=UPI0035BADAF0